MKNKEIPLLEELTDLYEEGKLEFFDDAILCQVSKDFGELFWIPYEEIVNYSLLRKSMRELEAKFLYGIK